MYSNIPSLVLGFHGCDRTIGESVINDPKNALDSSTNPYDWLGHGMYFWENSVERAVRWAEKAKVYKKGSNREIKDPFVLGAVIDLGRCLNLTDSEHSMILKECYVLLTKLCKTAGKPMPKNTKYKKDLDCVVINLVDFVTDNRGLAKYDSVRAPYLEGKELYPGAEFQVDTHIQICVRNPNCIKGYFHVREPVDGYNIP